MTRALLLLLAAPAYLVLVPLSLIARLRPEHPGWTVNAGQSFVVDDDPTSAGLPTFAETICFGSIIGSIIAWLLGVGIIGEITWLILS